jgi:pimeloyl-ACP methyl ester carboxylesterase
VVEPSDVDTSVRTVVIHGYDRAYRMAGSGPALLLLHGIGDSSDGWEPLMADLATRFTVIAPDLLGHGRSAKPRADYSVAAYANGMRDLLDVLDVEAATVVGHSLGGGVAAQFAYQYPERCERLILVASGGVGPEVHPALRAATVPLAEIALLPLQLPISRLGARIALEVLRRSGSDLGRDAADLQRVLQGMPDGASRGAFARTLRSVVDWRGQVVTMRDRAYLTAEIPILLIWGAHDAIIPVEHARLAHEAMPTARLEIFAEAGHFPHHADPERFVQCVHDFVGTTEPSVHLSAARRAALRTGGRAVTAAADERDGPDLALLG